MANVDELFRGWIIKVQNRRLELSTAKQIAHVNYSKHS